MPRPPNHSKQRRPARAPKRTDQASARHHANVVAFPVVEEPQAGASVAASPPEIQQAIDTTLSLTPLQLLAVTIKAKLGDRIEEEEVQRICQAYYVAVLTIWGDEEE
jgi:hypothetical protein